METRKLKISYRLPTSNSKTSATVSQFFLFRLGQIESIARKLKQVTNRDVQAVTYNQVPVIYDHWTVPMLANKCVFFLTIH